MLATDIASPSTSPPANPQPEADRQRDPEQRRDEDLADRPGTATFRTASRSLIEKWMPTPNISRITPISASSAAVLGVGDEPGVNGPMATPASR